MSVTITPILQANLDIMKNIPGVVSVQLLETNNLIDIQIGNVPSYIFEMSDGHNTISFVVPQSLCTTEVVSNFPVSHVTFWLDGLKNRKGETNKNVMWFIEPTRQLLVPVTGSVPMDIEPQHQDIINVLSNNPLVSNVVITKVIDSNVSSTINSESAIHVTCDYSGFPHGAKINMVVPENATHESIENNFFALINSMK